MGPACIVGWFAVVLEVEEGIDVELEEGIKDVDVVDVDVDK